MEGATHYLVDVATDEAFTELIPGYESLDVGPATVIEATDLPPGVYFYRVRAVNQAGPGSFSPTQSVEVNDDPLLLLADFEAPEYGVGALSGQAGWSVSDNAQGPRRLEVQAGGLTYSKGSLLIDGGSGKLRSFLSGEAAGDPIDLVDAIHSLPALQAGNTLYFSYLFRAEQGAPFHWFALSNSAAAERAMGVFADSASGHFGLRVRDGSQTSEVLSGIATTGEATRLIVGKLVLNGQGQNDALFASIDPDTLDEPESWDLALESVDLGAESLGTLVLRSRATAVGQFFDAIRLGASYESVLPPTVEPIDLDADSIGNGLPDSWEMFHFGEIGIDPDDDADGDGTSNRFEYFAGTDPRDRSSVFQIRFVREGEDATSVVFSTFADRSYRLWASKDLMDFEILGVYEGNGSEVLRALPAIEDLGTCLFGVEFLLTDPGAEDD